MCLLGLPAEPQRLLAPGLGPVVLGEGDPDPPLRERRPALFVLAQDVFLIRSELEASKTSGAVLAGRRETTYRLQKTPPSWRAGCLAKVSPPASTGSYARRC